MFPLAGDKMKKEKKNYWKMPFNILIVLNVLVFCYAILKLFLPCESHIRPQVYCPLAVNCTQCIKGRQTCHYYDVDDVNNIVISNDTIECNCEVENEEK
jgi:hypothetical protein